MQIYFIVFLTSATGVIGFMLVREQPVPNVAEADIEATDASPSLSLDSSTNESEVLLEVPISEPYPARSFETEYLYPSNRAYITTNELSRLSKNEITLKFSLHAVQRMIEREIDVNQVYQSVQNGTIAEIQDYPEFDDVHVVFQELTVDFPAYYVIVAHSYPKPVVVTVCLTLDEVWDWSEGFLKPRCAS